MEHKKNYMVCKMKESLCEELTESSRTNSTEQNDRERKEHTKASYKHSHF